MKPSESPPSPQSSYPALVGLIGIIVYHGISWNIVEYRGTSWNIMEYRGIAWNSYYQGLSWNVMEYRGILWNSMEFILSWMTVDYRGVSWNVVPEGPSNNQQNPPSHQIALFALFGVSLVCRFCIHMDWWSFEFSGGSRFQNSYYHRLSWNIVEYRGISWNIMEYLGISCIAIEARTRVFIGIYRSLAVCRHWSQGCFFGGR